VSGNQDVALSALCLALRLFTCAGRVVLDVEKHGRDLAGVRLDLSDSVGWFTALVPAGVRAASDPRAG